MVDMLWAVIGGKETRAGRTTNVDRSTLVIEVDEPNATTTGVLPGTTLTTHPGDYVITTPGTTISDQEIFGTVYIRAANVTINNCKIRGSSNHHVIDATNAACINAVITNCEIFTDYPNNSPNGIQGQNFTIQFCNIYGTVDGINIAGNATNLNVVAKQNYIHDLCYITPDSNHSDNQTHNDAIQIQGGLGPLLIQGNSIHGSYSQTVGTIGSLPDRGTGDITNGRYNWAALTCIQFTDNPTNVYTASTGNNVRVWGNWMYGGKRALNAGSANNTDIGSWWRNKFDDTQGERGGGSLAAKAGYTASMDATTTCDTGEGTSNANIYMSDGSEITVRRNQ